MNKKLNEWILAASLALVTVSMPAVSSADGFFKGTRGPTDWRLDEIVSSSENNKGAKTTSNIFMLKYNDGSSSGKWGYLTLPYKSTSTPKGNNEGVGDITLAFGPRWSFNNFHIAPYIGAVFPTGDISGKVKLSNERIDTKVGSYATYLLHGKIYDIDAVLEYNFTGENRQGVNPPNETYTGLFTGAKVSDNIRVGMGILETRKENGDHATSTRIAVRYTPSQKFNFEFSRDTSVHSRNIPRTNSVSAVARYNF